MLTAADMTDALEPIYTWIAPTGENINIAAMRLRMRLLLERPRTSFVVLQPELAKEFLALNAVSEARVKELTWAEAHEPVILARAKPLNPAWPDVLLVDGRHRYTWHMLAGRISIEAWVLEPVYWQQFQIVGLDDLSKNQLATIPPRGSRPLKGA